MRTRFKRSQLREERNVKPENRAASGVARFYYAHYACVSRRPRRNFARQNK